MSESLKRYTNQGADGFHRQDYMGEYVEYPDYAKLQERVQHLENGIGELNNSIVTEVDPTNFVKFKWVINRLNSLLSTVSTGEQTQEDIGELKVISIAHMQGKTKTYTNGIEDGWSEWYEYKEPLDFDDEIIIKVKGKDGYEWSIEQPIKELDTDSIGHYSIKLDGVRVIEYEKYLSIHGSFTGIYNGHLAHEKDVIGHDPYNKIIIIKGKDK